MSSLIFLKYLKRMVSNYQRRAAVRCHTATLDGALAPELSPAPP